MAFQLSPGVLVTEKDLTSVVPAVATTAGGFAGAFQWGPVDQVVTVDSENTLVDRFGKPNSSTFQSFFTAANFLSYGNNLQVIRVVNQATARNAKSNVAATAVIIKNETQYDTSYSNGEGAVGEWAAKYPGALGNSLKVSIADANTWSGWTWASSFDGQPGTSTYTAAKGGSFDEVHVVVADADGTWTGTAGTVLERFPFASKASDARKSDGTSNYIRDVVNTTSKYIYWMDHSANVTSTGTAWGSQANASVFANLTTYGNVTHTLNGGVSADTPSDGNLQSALATFANDEAYDISLLPLGNVSTTVANYAISSVAEVRKDLIVFVSPQIGDVVNNVGSEAASIVTTRNSLTSSSYAVMDSGWKYQYDRYNLSLIHI
mgnify:CR=1 FL=1